MYIDLQEYESFTRSPFLDEGVEVTFPRKVTSCKILGNRAIFHVEAIVCKKQPIVVSMLMTARDFLYTGRTVPMTLSLDFYKNRVIRVQLSEGDAVRDARQIMIDRMPEAAAVTALENDDAVTLLAEGITAEIRKDPYCLNIKDESGRLIYHQYNNDFHNVTNDRRRGHREGDDGKTVIDVSLQYPSFEVYPFGKVTNPKTGASAFAESASIDPNESFYGFGERFSPIDKNGQYLLNWVINPVGVSNSKAYKCVPFFYSTKGYGVYYNTPRKIRFSMGQYYYKAYEALVEADDLDFFLFVGEMKDALKNYGDLTGHSVMPPKWAFGVWMSRNCYMTQKEVEEVADELRTQELPCDVMHIDWAYCKTYDYDFKFDKTRFPDVKAMSDRLLEKGIRLSVWQLPYVKKTADTYAEGAAKGYFAKEADGSTADKEAGEAVIDFSNPEAVAWYQNLLKDLLEQGIRVIKTDFGENAQDAYCYHGVSGKDMHNLYPLMYNKAAYDIAREIHPDDSLIWGRSAYAGNQRYPVYWGGDSDSDYNGMYHSLRGGLSLGLSGFPFWSHDVGGYFCTPEKNVYIRWLEFGMFSPLIRFHGTSPREPWAFGEEAVAIYRKYAAYRYSLMEYIVSEARKCIDACQPMLRALVLEYPKDPMVRKIDDEYLFGANLLVAPVFSDAPERSVYLPMGNDWVDFHSGKRYHGGQTVSVSVPLDIMPVFFRAGTATPRVLAGQCVDMENPRAITWDIVPQNGEASYSMRLGDETVTVTYRERTNSCGSVALVSGEGKGEVAGEAGGGVIGEVVGEITCEAPDDIAMSYRIFAPHLNKLAINGADAAFESNETSIVTIEKEA